VINAVESIVLIRQCNTDRRQLEAATTFVFIAREDLLLLAAGTKEAARDIKFDDHGW
jgi:hypothetical protein